MRIRAHWSTIGVILLAVATFGCENTGAAKQEGREAASQAGDALDKAADKAGEAAAEAGDAISAAKQTFDVKAALTADTAIDASHIDVDTNHDTKTVTLSGYVPSADHRSRAESIARDKAEGYTVVNRLTVAPPQ